ncbi:MAG: polysaccharide biosynthesis tyrosine autokinase [Candidatus Eisenbacteria bacterium]|nr:polysaccharide biosynthesis tyrosine autokinase [Candidatus Eisenbacteria bacterium]
MSEISKAMDRSRRERGLKEETSPGVGRVLSPLIKRRMSHWDAEQYLALASEIALSLPDLDSRAIVFACAVSGEGTSTVAREFATTVAERGESPSVLIDANLRRPTLHEAFRVRRDPGLTDHILGGADLSECVCETEIPRLSVIPAGRPVIAPPRVAGDEQVGLLIARLKKDFRFVILDAPPILSFREAVQYGSVADGVVTIVRAGHTRRQLHAHALDLLEEARANVLGTVLNRRRFYIPKFVYDRI